MMPRFLANIRASSPDDRIAARMKDAGLACILASERLQVFAGGIEMCPLENDAGVILGLLHPHPLRNAGPPDTRAILATKGRCLTASHWGNYVALWSDGAEVRALRAPFGDQDAFYSAHRGGVVIASDLALLEAALQARFTCAWTHVAAHLAGRGLRGADTCLAGVRELLGGECLVASPGGIGTETLWSPWDFTQPERVLTIEENAHRLRELADTCIAARAAPFEHVLIMLSGGLDSSILAASAAKSGARLSALTFTTGDPSGDERRYAETVSAHLDIPLVTAELALEAVDISRSAAAHLPRPIARAFAQAIRACKREAASGIGADAVFDGGGGDNLFCSLQSAAPLADRLRARGIGPSVWRTALDIAELAESNVLTVAAHGIARAWFRPPDYRWQPDLRFLSDDVARTASALAAHRWLKAPRGALPGRAAHVALMIAVENLIETWPGPLPELAPLMAQPLIEHCLGIPSWEWVHAGHNRWAARQAFAERLPRMITARRSKGTPDSFSAALYETRRSMLSEFLLDGVLVREGILDRAALENTLRDTTPVKGHDHLRILALADVEAWARAF
ncbi:asparagine synthetase B family protein [Sphingosinicella microcystinivorans]|uniref:asparagine synthase (glutamine-hydrolyzing) n=1 Tax=Sphingosinicella microcystinivorans TaxID=335406 RepID=A0AAD1D982_SPHMI|nr:asparagine synthetase B family protein [Sphingosinicella microcystinivorans]RKS86351.1 asparagine synthase (glutamine-hydrolysing) [Sphingosinicella microcystinivorans]BBE35604.1 asparagine synthase [Sphingosinicella microcystinivorans]